MHTQKAHMPQHIVPSGFMSSQGSQLRSRRSRLGFTDISRIQGMGCRKLSPPSSARADTVATCLLTMQLVVEGAGCEQSAHHTWTSRSAYVQDEQ